MSPERHDQDEGLILFVTGSAPRSERARANLARALANMGAAADTAREIDLLAEPGYTLEYGIFASPALLHFAAAAEPQLLYGDLSDEARLKRFLSNAGLAEAADS